MRFEVHHPDDLGSAIAEFRTLRGLTQAELAHQVGLNRTYLSHVEQGGAPAFIERVLLLTRALGLTITISDS